MGEEIGSNNVGVCIASLQMKELAKLVDVISSDQCKPIADMDKLSELQDFFVQDGDITNMMKNTSTTEICDIIGSASTCITEVAVDSLYEIIKDQHCCDDFRNEFQEYTGTTMDNMVKKIVTDVSAALCSTRESFDDKRKPMTCMDAMGPAFGDQAMNLLMMPNNQAKAAFNGEEFTNTKDEKVTFPDVYGACAVPIDALFSFISDMSFIQDSAIAKFFGDGECQTFEELQNVLGLPFLDDLVQLIPGVNISDTCFHLANGYSKDADWSVNATLPSGESVMTLVANTTKNGSGSDSGSDSDSDSSKSGASATASVSIAAIVIAAAQILL